MVKLNAVLQIEDGNNIYKIGDKIRVLMSPLEGHEHGYEYIGNIVNIQPNFIIVDTIIEYLALYYKEIDNIRFAKDGENFENTWNFNN